MKKGKKNNTWMHSIKICRFCETHAELVFQQYYKSICMFSIYYSRLYVALVALFHHEFIKY